MKHLEKALSFLLLISYLTKTHIQGANYSDSIIIAGLSGLVAFLAYLSFKQQPDIKADLLAEIEAREASAKVREEHLISLVKKNEGQLSNLKDDIGQIGIVAKRNGGNVQQYKF